MEQENQDLSASPLKPKEGKNCTPCRTGHHDDCKYGECGCHCRMGQQIQSDLARAKAFFQSSALEALLRSGSPALNGAKK
jgi:hypothetical protein